MLRHSLARWREVTWGDSPRISEEHTFKCNSERWDAGWVDSLPASSDITAVCDPTADFMLVMPVSSPLCPEKMVQGNYLRIRTYDIGASFELIFMKFTRLMRVYLWVNPIVFGNHRPNRTTDMGKYMSTKPAFLLSFSWHGIFYGKNLLTICGTPFPTEKGQLIFVIPGLTLPPKWPCPPKIFFVVILENDVFFVCFYFEKIVLWKIFETSFPTKKVILSLSRKNLLFVKLCISYFIAWVSR